MRNNKKDEYLGKRFVNKYGEVVEVIEYFNNKDVTIKFDYGYIRNHVSIGNLNRGMFTSPYTKKYCGVGYLGEGRHKPTINGIKTKAYVSWCGVVERCYGKGSTLNKRGYESKLSEEWHNFQNFAEWFEEHYYEVGNEKMCVDKDLLFKGNTLYSKDTCCIVPNSINTLLQGSEAKRGKYPIGVSYKKDEGFYARCNVNNKCVHIGVYNTPAEAFYAYKKFKEQVIKDKVDSMKDVLPNNVYTALVNYEVEEND